MAKYSKTTSVTNLSCHKSCTLNPLKTSLIRLCFRTRQALRREENKKMRSLEGSIRNLKFSPSTSILLKFFFPFIDIKCFLSSLKLQYRRTIVLLNKLKSDDGHAISRQEKRGIPKAPHDFPPRKDCISTPSRVALALPSPPPRVCTGVR